LGARGLLNEKTNYFIQAEVASNLLTYDYLGNRERIIGLDHFSVTFNQFGYGRIRVGLFKAPGPEESYQGIINIDYIEFTDFIAREMMEVFVSGNRRSTPSAGTNQVIGTPVNHSEGFSAVRDWGVQLFDRIQRGKWEHSFSLMLGRGAGIASTSRSQNKVEQYYYFSSEYDLPGKKGPKKNGIKLYGWLHRGERVFSSDPLKQRFDRVRQGLGLHARGKFFSLSASQRFDIQLLMAKGMLFIAPGGLVKGGDLMFAAQEGNKSRAVSIDYGIFVSVHWELMARWDKHELLYRSDGVVWSNGDERHITTMTYGLQYHFSPKLRITANYIDRKVEAPNEPHPVVQNLISSVEERFALQLTWIY